MRNIKLSLLVFALGILGCEKSGVNEKPGARGGKQASPTDAKISALEKIREEANKAFQRGLALFDENDFDAAIAAHSEAIRLDPSMADAFNSRGVTWQEKGQYDKATEDFGAAIRLSREPNFAIYVNRGNALRAKKEYDKAIVDFNKAIELAPENARCFDARGNAWCEKREYDKGIADLTEAIRLNPKLAQSYSVRANAWGAKKEHDKAITDYTEAIRLAPTAKRYQGRAGVWALHKKDYAKAIADWSEAMRLDPKDKTSMLFAASYLAIAGDAKIRDGKKALELAKRAFAIDNDDALCLITMAAAYAETGDFEEAVRWQEKAVQHPRTLDVQGARAVLSLYQNKQPNRLVD
jgi:tetratricopeptide (TPR) repeat protein